MSSYVQDSLAPGEEVRYKANLSLWRYSGTFFLGAALLAGTVFVAWTFWPASQHGPGSPAGIATAVFVLIGALLLVRPFIARRSTELLVTDRRLIARFGLVSTHSIEVRLSKIESVRVTQGLLGKLFHYGDILVTGTGSTFDPIRHISHPLALRNALNQAMELNSAAAPLDARPPAQPRPGDA